MLITLNNSQPLYRQIYDQLRGKVLSGELAAGQKLPSSRDLAVQLGVSRTSVLQAFEQLASEGYTYTKVGAGTFIVEVLPDAELVKYSVAADREAVSQALPLSKTGKTISRLFAGEWQPWQSHPAPRYDFRVGGVRLHDRSLAVWRRLMHDSAGHISDTLDHPQGNTLLRESIADYLRIHRGCRCDVDNVVIVNGSQHGFDLIARLLINEGDRVALECPGYIGVEYLLAMHRAKLLPIEVDEEGIEVAQLEKKRIAPKLVYVTPSHQFPTGVVMSLARRLALIDWAKKNDAYIIEDDYDGEYRYDGRPIESVQGLDAYDRTIYAGTFSKVLFPSLRLGYVVLPKSLVSAFVALRWLTDFQSSSFQQLAMTRWMSEGHHQQHIRRMRKIYSGRRSQLIESVERHFGKDQITVSGANAGLHVLVWFDALAPEMQQVLLARCAKASIAVLPVDTAKTAGNRCALALGFTAIDEDKIDEGVKALGKVVAGIQ